MEVKVWAEEEKIQSIGQPEEWIAKVKELGLNAQMEMVEGKSSPNPFTRLDKGQLNILHVVLSASEDIEDFNKEPIPMKTLGAYGLAKKEGYFKSVVVRYSPNDPDSVMLGVAGNDTFLMASWGPEPFSWDALRKKAIEKLRPKILLDAKEELESAKLRIENCDLHIEKYLNGEWVRGL